VTSEHIVLMMTNPRKWNIIIRSRFCLLENLSRMQLVTVFRVKEGLVVMIMVKAGGGGVRGRLEMVENVMQKKRNVDIVSYFSSL
jgi:hypothetical protein